jgi:uncharacterized protein YndB with AHSA1/START domain
VSDPSLTAPAAAQAMADLAAGTIHAQIDIDAPPADVYQALTDPAELAAWWGSPDTYRTFDWAIDLRVGGAWSCQAEDPATGRQSTVRGEYLELDPPHRLAYTWQPSWDNFLATVIRIELQPVPSGTRVRLIHSGFEGRPESCQGHSEGWKRVLGWLALGIRQR